MPLIQAGTLRCLNYITTVFNLNYFLLQLTAPNSLFKLLFCATNSTVSRVIAVLEEEEEEEGNEGTGIFALYVLFSIRKRIIHLAKPFLRLIY